MRLAGPQRPLNLNQVQEFPRSAMPEQLVEMTRLSRILGQFPEEEISYRAHLNFLNVPQCTAGVLQALFPGATRTERNA
jgi:hypothetical protein